MPTSETPGAPAPVTHEIGRRTYVVAEVEPVDADGVRTVAVGTALWLVAFVGLLPFYGRLRDGGHLWWLWTCLAGFGLGLAGWDYCRRRRNNRLEAAAEEPPPAPARSGRLDLPADPPIAPPAPEPARPRPPAPARRTPPAPQKPPFTRRPRSRPGPEA